MRIASALLLLPCAAALDWKALTPLSFRSVILKPDGSVEPGFGATPERIRTLVDEAPGHGVTVTVLTWGTTPEGSSKDLADHTGSWHCPQPRRREHRRRDVAEDEYDGQRPEPRDYRTLVEDYLAATGGRKDKHGRKVDPNQKAPWYCYAKGDGFVQGWYEDDESLAAKLAFFREQGLAGIRPRHFSSSGSTFWSRLGGCAAPSAASRSGRRSRPSRPAGPSPAAAFTGSGRRRRSAGAASTVPAPPWRATRPATIPAAAS